MTLKITRTIEEEVLKIFRTVKRNVDILIKLLPVLSFIIPFLILYCLDPKSFEATWKGRTYCLFFLWLVSLEVILSWEKLRTNKLHKLRSIRTVAFILALLLPTIYVVAANFCGLNAIIMYLAEKNNIPFVSWMPLSTEYLVFTLMFALIILLEYGIDGLKDFTISTFFLGIIGMIYTIDNVYPYGRFTPFQVFVPATATLAANVLNLMGYQTLFLGTYRNMPTLIAWDSLGRPSLPFSIAWPCSGVESLIIYTITILLFLKKTPISWKYRTLYFVIGAIITYLINVLRIATIFVISINGGDWLLFHNYYGQLYSITWIVSYPLIMIGSRALWRKIRNVKTMEKDVFDFSVQTRLSN